MSDRFVKFSNRHTNVRLAALFAVLLCLGITPLMASASALVQESFDGWSGLLLIERLLGPQLESSGLITFGNDPNTPYRVYGKAFFLVYLGLAPLLYFVRPTRPRIDIVRKVNRFAWQAMFLAVLTAMTGDFVSYWGQSIPGEVGDQLWGGGFGLELLSLLVLILSTLIFAITNLLKPVLPRWVSLVLIAGILSLAPFNAIVTDYWPNGLVVPISISWVAVAVMLPREWGVVHHPDGSKDS